MSKRKRRKKRQLQLAQTGFAPKKSADPVAPFNASGVVNIIYSGFDSLAESMNHATKAFENFGEALGGGAWRPRATEDTWVARGQDGEPKVVRVKDMTDSHLWRWIRYFRKKWRDEGFAGPDGQLDSIIQAAIITGPAIYAEATKRGLMVIDGVPLQVQPATPVVPPEPGKRRITLEDD